MDSLRVDHAHSSLTQFIWDTLSASIFFIGKIGRVDFSASINFRAYLFFMGQIGRADFRELLTNIVIAHVQKTTRQDIDSPKSRGQVTPPPPADPMEESKGGNGGAIAIAITVGNSNRSRQ